MAGYQTIEALRPILRRGPPAVPVVNRELVKGPPKTPLVGKRKAGIQLSDAVIAEIVRRREDFESLGKISAALNVSPSSVRRYTRHVAPPPGGWPDCYNSGMRSKAERNVEFARRLRRAGFSFHEIGQELGCSRSAATRAVRGYRAARFSSQFSVTVWVQRASEASGVPCRQIRKCEFRDGRAQPDISKARHILFWLLRTYRSDLSFPAISRALGGFNHTSALHGFAKADAVAQRLGITAKIRPLTAARALWAADWREVSK